MLWNETSRTAGISLLADALACSRQAFCRRNRRNGSVDQRTLVCVLTSSHASWKAEQITLQIPKKTRVVEVESGLPVRRKANGSRSLQLECA